MTLFHYRAVTSSGELVRGSAEFDDPSQLVASLRARSLTPERIRHVPAFLANRRRRLGAREVAEFCYFLSEYTRSGADIRTALADMGRSASTRRIRTVSAGVLARVERGDSVSQALRESRAFPGLVTSLVTVGEETAHTEQVFSAASAHYEQVVQIRATLLRALVYPMIAVAMLLLGAAFWVGFVLPKLASLFGSLMPRLPASTRSVLEAAEWLRTAWPLVVLGFLILVVTFGVLWRHPALRPVTDWIRWHAPAYGRLERVRNFQMFFSNLGLMYGAGMTVTRSLEVLRADTTNRFFRNQVAGVEQRMRRGNSLGEAMRGARGIEPIALGMIQLAERTGSLAQQCERLAQHYQRRLKALSELLVRLFEPALLLVIGAMLAAVVLTIIMPIYELVQASAGGALR